MKLINSSEIKEISDALFNKWLLEIRNNISYIAFEHIGSTSITDCLTKGDIDFYLEVKETDHQRAVDLLIDLGFKIKSDTHRDQHLCMLQNKECAIQVVSTNSKYIFFKVFRNKLNSEPDLVKQYNKIKFSSQGLTEDEYRERKAKFIRSVL